MRTRQQTKREKTKREKTQRNSRKVTQTPDKKLDQKLKGAIKRINTLTTTINSQRKTIYEIHALLSKNTMVYSAPVNAAKQIKMAEAPTSDDTPNNTLPEAADKVPTDTVDSDFIAEYLYIKDTLPKNADEYLDQFGEDLDDLPTECPEQFEPQSKASRNKKLIA